MMPVGAFRMLRLRYRVWKIRALMWVLRRTRAGRR